MPPVPTNPRFQNLTGQKFGRLTVIAYDGKRGKRHHYWLCRCECGTDGIWPGSNLLRGNTRSCGCFRVETSSTRMTRHGWYKTRTYGSWVKLTARCKRPADPAYSRYGGRGIKVCERWASFDNFLADMGPCPSDAHSIDRINNNGNYEPGNCRWATQKEQANNKRNNRLLTHGGVTRSVTAWEDALGFPPKSIHNRLLKGWTPERALTTPIRRW